MSKEYTEAFEVITGDNYHCDEETFYHNKAIVEQALQRLEAIDNAEPSEALECLESVREDYHNSITKRYYETDMSKDVRKELFYKYDERLNTIKQALLKGQEPKQYLKWEDLEKFKDMDSVKVKMNDTELSLIIQIDCLNDIYVQLYKEKEDGNCVNLLSDFFRNKELFNDLHLERAEE